MPAAAAEGVRRRGERVMTLHSGSQLLAAASYDQRRTRELLALLSDPVRVNEVRDMASGKLLCVTGLYGRDEESMQLLLTQLFAQAMEPRTACGRCSRRWMHRPVRRRTICCGSRACVRCGPAIPRCCWRI